MDGADLKAWRKARDYTQASLAADLEVTRQTVITWESSTEPLPRLLALALSALDQGRNVAGKKPSAAEVKAFRERTNKLLSD